MNVEIGAEAALFPEKEYINGIAVAVNAKIVVNHVNRGHLLHGGKGGGAHTIP
jgi:hypothetical protein